jgi:hypothetical protein
MLTDNISEKAQEILAGLISAHLVDKVANPEPNNIQWDMDNLPESILEEVYTSPKFIQFLHVLRFIDGPIVSLLLFTIDIDTKSLSIYKDFNFNTFVKQYPNTWTSLIKAIVDALGIESERTTLNLILVDATLRAYHLLHGGKHMLRNISVEALRKAYSISKEEV